MAAITSPELRLQSDLTRRPYGGGWWPDGRGVSHELLDLMHRWPADLPKITSYAYISDDWDRSEASVPLEYRTRTLILVLADRSTCRLLQLPASTPADVADELLTEASYSGSMWRRIDFVSTYRGPQEMPAVGTHRAAR
ncbi:hypothetical protein F0U44_19635 [Nocardioides humilatus]|uniref:Uncharacterized protein n=1 Tax=Nocardioides humilatus TaxID=2607660 RepID=A0A5B1L5C2_9ACTN|nr:DUF5994 family protein [Nocardioides humilatus]KAA1415853.1 hypothetical protein F0U44_19635 [Nocardioides humilatus]